MKGWVYMIRISKDFVEKFFVRDNEIFNLAIDFEAFMWSLDNVVPNDDETDYIVDMKKGTIHLTEPMYFTLSDFLAMGMTRLE